MLQTVDEIIEVILRHEGGYVDHKNDRGGATNWGITIGTYSGWLGREATKDEVRNMDRETAITIYKQNYYYGPGINHIPHPVQAQVFDIGVNSGPKRGIKMVQRVVNLAGFGPIGADGVIGPQSVRAITEAQDKMGNYFNNALVEERLKFYNGIVERNPSQKVFIRGWTKRANSFNLQLED